MTEEEKNGESPDVRGIEGILKERDRLEQVLKEKYRKRLTIFFSDICGYTQYIDSRGDISGRSLLLKHNSILLPEIEKHGGKVVEIIGDAVMASFSESLAGVKAAVAVQEALRRYNETCEAADKIHVKIGINTGEALVDETVVFQSITGDVANVASRIQSQAGKDEILISRQVYEAVRGSEDVLCRYHGTVQVKGKKDPQRIYRVVWRHGEAASREISKVRFYEAPPEAAPETEISVIQVEITREGDRLKIGAHERLAGEESTLRHYEEIQVSMASVEQRCRELVETLNKTNRRGLVSREVLVKLREIGQVLHDELLTFDVKRALRETRAEYLRLSLDDQLVHIPWELLSDGKRFLCQRFNMGRLVKTRQNFSANNARSMGRPLKMLVIADPKGDLKGAYKEGTRIRDDMDSHSEWINATLRSDDIRPESIMEKMRNFDLVHFAGHADYNPENPEESGWRLSDGCLTTKDILRIGESSVMPALIFSNACQSARTEAWSLGERFEVEIFGLANAFLLAGVKHYVGTFWEILDKPSGLFARAFYRHLLDGDPVGGAIRNARSDLIHEYGEENIVWASYLLYGDPAFRYVRGAGARDVTKEERIPEVEAVGAGRTRERPVAPETPEVFPAASGGKGRKWLWAAVCAAILAVALVWFLPGVLRQGPSELERQALSLFRAGDYPGVIKACDLLQRESPQNPVRYLLLGKVAFSRGDLEKARKHFDAASRIAGDRAAVRAEALVGLGRIASIRRDVDGALGFYRKAAGTAPDYAPAYVSQALVLNRKGSYEEALRLLDRARALSPGDQSLVAMSDDTRARAALLRDREKQARIDRLVADLVNQADRVRPAPATDGWTSLPLTAWIMELRTLGYGFQEGEERLVGRTLVERLMASTRIQVVERALLDRLLEELKLGTSRLVDSRAALRLGRILAARLIVTGRLAYMGPEKQVSIRVIETETGRVTASMSETFKRETTPPEMAKKLALRLSRKLGTLYPLRGKVIGVDPSAGVTLNIGTRQGVRRGQCFKVLDQAWELVVESVSPEQSLAVIRKGGGRLEPGPRVEACREVPG